MASLLFRQARVFDGESVHTDYDVLVVDGKIAQLGSAIEAPADAEIIEAVARSDRGTPPTPALLAAAQTRVSVLQALSSRILGHAEPRSYAAWSTDKEPTYGFLSLPPQGPAAAPPGAPGWLLGQADCGRPDCAAAFGAVVFTVEAVK